MRNVAGRLRYALRQFRQPKGVLQCLLDRLRVRLHHAETLVIRLLSIVPGQIEERAFVTSLRHEDVDAGSPLVSFSHLFRQHFFQRFPILEPNWDVNVPWNIRLPDIKLLEQSG